MEKNLALILLILAASGCVKSQVVEVVKPKGFQCEQAGSGALSAKIEFVERPGDLEIQLANLTLENPEATMMISDMVVNTDESGTLTIKKGLVNVLDGEGHPTDLKIFVGDTSEDVMTIEPKGLQASINLDSISNILEMTNFSSMSPADFEESKLTPLDCTDL